MQRSIALSGVAAPVLRWRRPLFWLGVAALFALLPMAFRQSFALSMLSQMGIAIIFALSYNMLLGQTGLLSFGHAVYFGLGAFFTAHAINWVGAGKLWFPITFMPLVGGAAGLFFGLILGFVTTRRAGTPFAMISLGIAEMVAASALMFTAFFGGEGGIATNRTAGGPMLGVSYGPQIEVYYLIAAWCLVCMLLMYALTRTPLGRMANAVRDNPERAQFVGYNPTRVRWLMLTLAGFFAGIAGGLAAINYEIVTAETLGVVASGNAVLMAFIGGIGHFWGPILGAVLVTFLQSALSTYTQAWLLYFGLLFLVIILFSPGGIANLITMHRPVWTAGLIKRLLPSYALGAATGAVMLAGLVGLVEMIYHVEAHEAATRTFRFLGIALDPGRIGSWLAILALLAVGLALFSRAARSVRRAWDDITPQLQAREAA
ncbi:MAG TPA: branched-chain amino acid ABC transporter permease [Burkholderiales bacterium]|jgi:branched-chain amino acid transport system permease protein|nr:branched-chain amino acid ABC transporter permease [Burkholderiales bacterium]